MRLKPVWLDAIALSRFYNFKGLYQFKEKFRPRWEPRYLVFLNRATLPDIAVGLVRADSVDRLLDYLWSNRRSGESFR
jgi:phosphatidylglycerol lysyltransferase